MWLPVMALEATRRAPLTIRGDQLACAKVGDVAPGPFVDPAGTGSGTARRATSTTCDTPAITWRPSPATRELMGRMGHPSREAALLCYQHRTTEGDAAIAQDLDKMLADSSPAQTSGRTRESAGRSQVYGCGPSTTVRPRNDGQLTKRQPPGASHRPDRPAARHQATDSLGQRIQQRSRQCSPR